MFLQCCCCCCCLHWRWCLLPCWGLVDGDALLIFNSFDLSLYQRPVLWSPLSLSHFSHFLIFFLSLSLTLPMKALHQPRMAQQWNDPKVMRAKTKIRVLCEKSRWAWKIKWFVTLDEIDKAHWQKVNHGKKSWNNSWKREVGLNSTTAIE